MEAWREVSVEHGMKAMNYDGSTRECFYLVPQAKFCVSRPSRESFQISVTQLIGSNPME